MGGLVLWVMVVLLAVVASGASAMSVINEEEEKQLIEKIDGENVAPVRETEREDRVFLIFAKVQPKMCVTNHSTDTDGTCLTSHDCKDKGGIASGTCASGLGVCCIITRTCNEETSMNNTYFQNPPASDVGACSLTINRIDKNICQIRLDFNKLELSQPDSDGNCVNDFFYVTGVLSQVPRVCGTMSGQHMYFDLDPNGGAVKVTIDRSTLQSLTTNWDIKVAQISCDSEYRAPVGCLQYYTETVNDVMSFNFDGSTTDKDTKQLANLEYSVCIRRADNNCGIKWQANTASMGKYTFTVSENAAVVDESLIGTIHASSQGDKCTTDYVVIPGGMYYQDTDLKQADRYCGLGFPDLVTSYAQPFNLYVKTDGNETMDKQNRGFSLKYRQIPCT